MLWWWCVLVFNVLCDGVCMCVRGRGCDVFVCVRACMVICVVVV